VTALDPATVRALDARLAREQSAQRLPSVTAALVRGGEVVWSGAAGTLDGRPGGTPASADVQYRIGSITKTFVAVAVLRLRDAGRLDLADPVGVHLPELACGHVTVAQLLTHTSGLQAENDGDWWERTAGRSWEELAASSTALRSVPGTRFHYSNVGYAVLGELVTRVSGRPWPEVVRDELLTPLGMTRTTMRPDAPAAPGLAVHPFADLVHAEPEHDAVAMAPAGQLWSSAHDLARWAAFLGGRTDGVLRPETLQESLVPVAVNDLPGLPWTTSHALGWQVWNVGGRRYAGHGGSMPGFLASLRVDLGNGDGAVVLANATSGLGPVGAELLDLLAEREPPAAAPAWTADPSQSERLDLVGDWFWGTYHFRVVLERDGVLRLGEPGQGRGARFRPTGDGTWIGEAGYYADEPLRLRRDASGAVVALEVASFVFTRTPYDPGTDVPGGHDDLGWH
jgi:CubicO group peptidase (beta-lactamase class C family)